MIDDFDDMFRWAKFPSHLRVIPGLEIALDEAELAIEHGSARASTNLMIKLAQDEVALPEDKELDRHSADMTRHRILPSTFRGGFLLALWSAFEVAVKRIAIYVATQRGIDRAKLEVCNRGSLLRNMRKTFDERLKIPAFSDASVHDRLETLGLVRNAWVHDLGSAAELRAKLKLCDADIEKAGLRIVPGDAPDLTFFLPTHAYLRSNLDLVAAYLKDLSQRAYIAAHPDSSGGIFQSIG